MNHHWGNAGDIVKHCLLVAWLDSLKPGVLRTYVETHAGAPLYGPQGPVPFRETEHPHVADLLDLYRSGALPPRIASLPWLKELSLLNASQHQSIPHYLGSPAWAFTHFPGLGAQGAQNTRMLLIENDPESIKLLMAWAERRNGPPTVTVLEGDGPSLVSAILPIELSEQGDTVIFIDPFAWTDELDAQARSWLHEGSTIIGWYPIFDPRRPTFKPLADLGCEPECPLARVEVIWDIDAKSPLVGAGMFFAPCKDSFAEELTDLGCQLEKTLRMALEKAESR